MHSLANVIIEIAGIVGSSKNMVCNALKPKKSKDIHGNNAQNI